MSKETYAFDNVEVMWTKVDPAKPEPAFIQNAENPKPDSWNAVLVLNDEQADSWKKEDMSPMFKRDKYKDLVLHDGKRTIQVSKSATFGYGGAAKKPVMVVDTYGNPLTGLIGNGSKCNVQCSVRSWEFNGNKGRTADLEAIQILELVEYESTGDGEEDFVPTFNFAVQDKKSLAEVTAGEAPEDEIPF